MSNGVRREFPRLIPRVRRGQRPKASHQNEIVDSINRRVEGVDARPQQRVDSTRAFTAPELGRFRIKTVKPDYLICRAWNGTEEGENDVFVAKPFILRESLTEHAGFTFTYASGKRTADNGTDTEVQVVKPSYQADDEIIAMKGIARGTGARTLTERRVEWFDLNVDARMWAREAE